jgi:electron transfer flavoprotein beta subunit
MKILVCVKQVPQKDAPLKIDEKNAWINEDTPFEINEPDAYAIEEALRLREKNGGEIVAVTVGPARAQQVLRDALAKGVDRAIHIEDSRFARLSGENVARLIVDVTREEKVDLVLTGLQSDDVGAAQVGVIVAELLGWAHGTIVLKIEKNELGLRIKRELEGGFYQFVNLPLPAVLTIQSGSSKLRYPTLMGIKQAKNKPLKVLKWDQVSHALIDDSQRIEKLYVPLRQKKTEFIEGTAAVIAQKLVEKFRSDLRIL